VGIYHAHIKCCNFGLVLPCTWTCFFFLIGDVGTSGTDAWFYGMFSLSQILSPLLPAVLVIGQSQACNRLLKKGILCVDLKRITIAGKVKVFCFDKTGTLTKEGLNFLGVQPSSNLNGFAPTFAPLEQDFGKLPSTSFLYYISICNVIVI
jgi:P-type E1-E2 ATPase